MSENETAAGAKASKSLGDEAISLHRRLLDCIGARRWQDAAELYAEDCWVEMPFALPDPVRIVGRESVRRHFTAAARAPLSLEVVDPSFHLTADPEVVIGEFGYAGRVETTGKTFLVANIQVVRVRAGQIVETRDYHDHARLAQVMLDAG
jgi:ketosteroid isomerase-like protein